MNSIDNFKLNERVSTIHNLDFNSWSRLSDYLWNTGFILEQSDLYLEKQIMTQEQIRATKEEYLTIVWFILSLDVENILKKLQDNPLEFKWTYSNFDSIKKALIN